MEKNWKIKPQANQDEINKLATDLNIEKTLANMLLQRGVKTYTEAKIFFRPELNALHDPFLMRDMDKAVQRLERAIQNQEKILIYGDYDVDGTTSVALVYAFLRENYNLLGYYVPDRYNEGYGISTQGIDYAEDNGFTLIIALDCGIKAIEKVNYAKSKNIDFIICDHHTAGAEIPEAVAVLDPKRPDCSYPFKELSGCGVGFKFMQAYSSRNNISFEKLTNYLDLVCVSISSDIVPITGENRILAYYGLLRLNQSPRIGLRSILKIAGVVGKEITISDCVFKIGPRINAAGRIKSGLKAVELLIAENEDIAKEFSEVIDDYNITRKNLDFSITQEALTTLQNNEELKKRKTTVLFNSDWHKGVIGIVASRLIEQFYRPTIILTESHGLATGSARSVEGFDLYEAVEACQELLEGFGGHKYAAGLTMKKENIKAFQEKFEKIVASSITAEQLIPQIEVDAIINFGTITQKFFKILKQFAPFGPENMSPIFVTKNVRDTGNCRPVGNTGEHLKLEVIDIYGNQFSGIAFGMAHYYPRISTGKPFHICYSVEENEFRGSVSLQLMIRDIKF